jgi:urea transporter
MKYLNFIKSLFRGIGQVMLQNNAITGLIFLAGVFYASWLMGVGAIVSVLSGTISALALGYKEKECREGAIFPISS